MIYAWLKYGVQKGLRYRANTISWFIADLALYSSTALMYLLLFSAFDNIGSYTRLELGLYISTYFLVNNLYSVFFAEAVSNYSESIYNGSYIFYQLNPIGVFQSMVLSNFNFPALLSTPYLISLNVYLLSRFPTIHWNQVIIYYASVVLASIIMLFSFLLLSTLLLYGIRSGAIESSISQLFAMAEKPDTAFHPTIKRIFTYIFPAFMFSAVPTQIILSDSLAIETLYLWGLPVLLYILYRIFENKGIKKYQHSGF